MPAAPSFDLRPLAAGCWRLVEAQHRTSILKLVDTLAEQAVLEDILEETKPTVPPECRHLDYLLSTPFRYDAPYPHGSRFRRAGMTPGVYYAALSTDTALAEMVFYRMLFFAEAPGVPLPDNASEYTAFHVSVETAKACDLTTLQPQDPAWADRRNYTACQAVADQVRATQGEIIRYRSLRDPAGGDNLGVLHCAAFRSSAPDGFETWRIRLNANGAQAVCDLPRRSLEFRRADFADDGRLG